MVPSSVPAWMMSGQQRGRTDDDLMFSSRAREMLTMDLQALKPGGADGSHTPGNQKRGDRNLRWGHFASVTPILAAVWVPLFSSYFLGDASTGREKTLLLPCRHCVIGFSARRRVRARQEHTDAFESLSLGQSDAEERGKDAHPSGGNAEQTVIGLITLFVLARCVERMPVNSALSQPQCFFSTNAVLAQCHTMQNLPDGHRNH